MMMAGKVDFYSGETLEAILAAMEDNLFVQDEDITAQIDEVVEAMEENQPVCRFSCDQCDKICKTQRDLRRHKSTKFFIFGKYISGSVCHIYIFVYVFIPGHT